MNTYLIMFFLIFTQITFKVFTEEPSKIYQETDVFLKPEREKKIKEFFRKHAELELNGFTIADPKKRIENKIQIQKNKIAHEEYISTFKNWNQKYKSFLEKKIHELKKECELYELEKKMIQYPDNNEIKISYKKLSREIYIQSLLRSLYFSYIYIVRKRIMVGSIVGLIGCYFYNKIQHKKEALKNKSLRLL